MICKFRWTAPRVAKYEPQYALVASECTTFLFWIFFFSSSMSIHSL
ncbi:hypothetical protein RSAG8_12243, partial [Rhizoctonia solani AG-8 WAC10335]